MKRRTSSFSVSLKHRNKMESLIAALLLNDPGRLEMLKVVAAQALPDCFIAAGFIRNKVWDFLHDFPSSSLNDVDVIYYDRQQQSEPEDIEKRLSAKLPGVVWQVKNQAVMHHRNQDPAYRNSTDAMRYWPEKETAVGARLNDKNQLELAAPFGIQSLLEGKLTHNPLRSRAVFEQRIVSKRWLQKWPKLQVIN